MKFCWSGLTLFCLPLLTVIGTARGGDRSIFDEDWVGPVVKPRLPATAPAPAATTRASPGPLVVVPPKPPELSQPVPPKLPPAPPPEPHPAAMFSSLFAADVKRVESTPAAKDDVEFAQRLLDAARAAADAPKLRRMLFERTVDFASRDNSGAAVALSALASLRSLYPREATTWDDRAVAIQEKVYRAAGAADRAIPAAGLRVLLVQAADRRAAAGQLGDALGLARRAVEVSRAAGGEEAAEAADLLRAITERQKLDQRATKLAERLGTDEGSKDKAAATEFAALVCSTLPGRLPEAAGLIARESDPVPRYLIDISTASHHTVTPTHAAWAGDWFRAAAETPAHAAFRAALLRRAAGWYAHFLTIHLQPDAERLRVLLSAQQVAERLTKAERRDRIYNFSLVGPASPLLTMIQPARHRVSGSWSITPGGVTADAGGPGVALMTLPVSPGDMYEISLQYSAEGATGVGLVLPIGRGSSVAITRAGTDCTVSLAAATPAPLGGQFPDVQKDTDRHTLYVRVISRGGTRGVLVALDGREVGRWEGKETDVTAPADLMLPDRSAIGIFIRGGHALLMDASLHSLHNPPQLLAIPGPTDLPLDGSRPRDALVEQVSATSVRFFHAGASVTFDPALPGGVAVTVAEPGEDVRLLKIGFAKMLEGNGANLAPLRIEYPRYKRLVAMLADVPRFCSDADAARLKELFRDREAVVGAEKKQLAERAIFVHLHGVAERYHKAAHQWVRYMQQTLTDAEMQLAGKLSK
jgi:hypothetical protein